MQDPYPQIDGRRLVATSRGWPSSVIMAVLLTVLGGSIWFANRSNKPAEANKAAQQRPAVVEPFGTAEQLDSNENAGETLQRILDVGGANRAIELGEELPAKMNLDPPETVPSRFAKEPVVEDLRECR